MSAIDTSDTGGVVIPLAIIAACLLIILIAVIARRLKLRRQRRERGAASADLGEWQSTRGHDVDRWLDAHEGTLPSLVPGADPAIDAQLDEAMAAAAEVCPDPGLASMLTGMRRSAFEARQAATDGDHPLALEAHAAYSRHRADAIARMSASEHEPEPSSAL